jgi:RimJ/RimL family protein N-acetyltransferase
VIEVVEIDERDLPRLLEVRNIVVPSDPASVAGYLDWRRQAEDMGWFLAIEDGADVGGGHALVGWHSAPGTATVEAWTVPEARGHGVGLALYEAMLKWAVARGCIAADTTVAEDDPASKEWAERRGFREIGRDSYLVLDLEEHEAPTLDTPEGIEIVTWAEHPGLEHGMYEVFVESSSDIPGEEDAVIPPFETWLENDMSGTSDLPEAVFVALAGSEVVGFAKLSIPEQDTGTAWHDLTGVRRAWRGRGIADALKRRQIRWAGERGFARLVTKNEARNEPIRRLNERYGYRVEPGRIVMHTRLGGTE